MNAMKINQIFIFACVGSIVFNYSLFLILSKLIPNAFQAGEGSHFVMCKDNKPVNVLQVGERRRTHTCIVCCTPQSILIISVQGSMPAIDCVLRKRVIRFFHEGLHDIQIPVKVYRKDHGQATHHGTQLKLLK